MTRQGFFNGAEPWVDTLFCIDFLVSKIGGEGGIRTHDTVLQYTRFRIELLRPLGHLSSLAFATSKGL